MNFHFSKKKVLFAYRNYLYIIFIILNYLSANSQIVSNGLVLHLDASNPSSYDGSGTQWNDISGNGNHVTMQNAGSISYDASNKFFNTGDNGYFSRASGTNIPVGNSNYTMIVYVNQPQWQDGNGFISIGGFQSGNRSNALRVKSGGLGNLVHYWWGNDINVNSNQASLNNWLYIVAKFDGTTRSVWVNGVLAGQDTPSGHNVNSSLIQISKTYGSEYQRGKIKVAMIYNRALSSNELSQNYTAITNPNSAPTDITLSSMSFNENIASASTVASLSATDSDNGDTHNFTLVSSGDDRDDDNGSFTINGNNLKINSSPDYETKASYNIYINVNDGANNYAKAFTVSVTNINEAPTDLGFSKLNLEYLIVAGGGGGGYRHASGGGAGGLLSGSFQGSANKTYSVTVGAGGAGGSNSTKNGSNGSNSQLSGDGLQTLTAIGGGGGTSYDAQGVGGGQGTGINGGSGGGASYRNGKNSNGGTATTGQGNNGGNIISSSGQYNHAGGGGAGAPGGNGTSTRRGDGGDGIQSSITGTATYYAGGGGGGTHNPAPSSGGGAGGQGGGGAGGTAGQNSPGVSGTANTGGGGGGASTSSGGNSSGGAGGSGIVILRYLGTPIASGGTITQNGGYTIHSFTQVGNSNLVVSSGSGSGTTTSTASFDEGSAVGTVVATLTATDTDTTNLTYSLATGNGTNDQHNSLFTVSGTQLLVASSTISYDTTTSLNVNLKVSDGDNILTKAFQIAVNDLNRAPTDIGLSSNTITENASPSTVIGTLSSVDLDTTDTTSFTLATSGDAQDDDNGSFTISGTSLILNSSPDYETKASYNIYINVNDGANNYAKAFTVSVTNINEAPTDLSFEAGSNVITDGLISHLDATNSESYNGSGNQWTDLSGNNNHGTLLNGVSFANNRIKTSNTGTGDRSGVRIGSLPILANNKSWTIVVKVTPRMNSGNILGLSSESNHAGWNAPVIPSAGGYIYPGVHNSHLQWSHPFNVDQEYEFVYSFNRTNNVNKFYIDGTLINTRTVAVNTGNNGTSYLFLGDDNPGCCANTNRGQSEDHAGDYERFLFYNRVLTDTEVQDLLGSSGSGSGTTTSTASFDEGSAIGTVVATLTATDSDTTNLTYSLATGNGTNDQHNSLFTVSGTQLLVASSTISYDTTTSLNVNLKVSDGQNTLTKAFQIAVNDLNRAPTDIGLTSNTITENASPSTVIGTLSSVDLDTTDTSSFTLATSGDAQDDDNGSFTISGTSLILNSSPDYETKASYNIYINVNDGANNYAKAFTVSVTNINEAPTDLGFGLNVIENGLIMYLDATNPDSRGTNMEDLRNGNHARWWSYFSE